ARYDIVSRLLLGSLFERIANDAAAAVPGGGRVLEVGCGPGRLSIALAGRRGLEVTGLDLDPAMIERARASAARAGDSQGPSFRVGDVAACRSRMGRSTSSSARSRCITGPTQRRASSR